MNEEVNKLLFLHCQLQSVMHTIDEIQYSSIYVKELKKRTNNYLRFIEPRIKEITDKIPVEEADAYIQIVKQMDDLIDKIKITE